jgi:replicative DNA helicase
LSEDIDLRVLPQSIDAEKALLGAMIINNAIIDQVLPLIGADHFFRHAHQIIFKAIITIALERHAAVDLVMLKDELVLLGELDECGGPAYISMLTDGVPRSTNAPYYAGIVREKALLRRAITIGNTMVSAAYHDDAVSANVIRDADLAIINLQRGAVSGRMRNLRDSAGEVYGIIEHHVEHRGELLGVDTGFPSINELTFGWQSGDLVVIAARPSIGKTAFVLNSVIAASRAGKRAVIFSLEMRRRQLEYRVLSQLSGVPLTRIMSGYLGEQDYERIGLATGAMAELDIEIDDSAAMTAWDVRSACRRLKAERGLDLVVIDYVQLMRGTLERRGASRSDEVGDISRRLKILADEVSVPVLLLSQLNRGADNRSDKRPQLTDLRESGALEQDADIVAFLHRKHHRESGTTNFIIEKQRNGPTGTVNLTIARETQTFTDGGDDPPEPEKPAEEKEKKPRPPRGWKRGH